MSGLIPLIHGDFDNRFEHGERVWGYKLKLKKACELSWTINLCLGGRERTHEISELYKRTSY